MLRLFYTFFIGLFLAGCTFEVSENALLLLEDDSLFDRKGKLTKAVGIEIKNGIFHPILPKGTRTPSADAIVFKPRANSQGFIDVRIFTGNSQKVEGNTLIGSYRIAGLLETSGDEREIQLILAVRKGKILAEATEPSTGRVLNLSLNAP